MAFKDVAFGSDFNFRIRQKLQERQQSTKDISENESVGTAVGSGGDLSSMTPFARIWTAIEVIRYLTKENFKTYSTFEELENDLSNGIYIDDIQKKYNLELNIIENFKPNNDENEKEFYHPDSEEYWFESNERFLPL